MNLKLLVCTTAIVATLSAQAPGALVTFNDGTEHTINSATGDRYLVQDGPGASTTTLIVESAAVIVGGGGNFQYAIDLDESSVADISGGMITGGSGFASDGVRASDSAVINLSGGTITAGSDRGNAVYLFDSSTLNMSGGSLVGTGVFERPLVAFDDSIFNFTGGNISGTIFYESTLNFFGVDFTLDGSPIDPGSYMNTSGTLAFTDADGIAQSMSLLADNLIGNPTLTLIAIPNPHRLPCSASARWG